MNDQINFEEDATPASQNTLPVVTAARRMYSLAQGIFEREQEIKKMHAELQLIERDQIPSMMEELGVAELPLSDGSVLKVADFIEANIPTEAAISKEKDPEARQDKQERREAAFKWLRENNSGAVIKKEVSVDLGKTEDEVVKNLRAAIDQFGFQSEQTEGVHAATLKKLLKEKMEAGVDIPFDTFAIYAGKKASIKPPKKS